MSISPPTGTPCPNFDTLTLIGISNTEAAIAWLSQPVARPTWTTKSYFTIITAYKYTELTKDITIDYSFNNLDGDSDHEHLLFFSFTSGLVRAAK